MNRRCMMGAAAALMIAAGAGAAWAAVPANITAALADKGRPAADSARDAARKPGDLLAYEDSSGNLAIAVSNGDAAGRLGAGTGARIGIRRA